MNNKQIFIEMVESLIARTPETLPAEGLAYFQSFKNGSGEKKPLSELAQQIYQCLVSHGEDASFEGMTSKDIAEEIDSTSRAVSGSMRKLINEGYVIRHEEGKVITYTAQMDKQSI